MLVVLHEHQVVQLQFTMVLVKYAEPKVHKGARRLFMGYGGGAAEGSDLECSVPPALAQGLHEDTHYPVQMTANLLYLPTHGSPTNW